MGSVRKWPYLRLHVFMQKSLGALKLYIYKKPPFKPLQGASSF